MQVYRKVKEIQDLKEGDVVKDIFVVKFKKPIREFTGGYTFALRVGDKSREIMLKYWSSESFEKVEELYNKINKDSVIYVEGFVNLYKGNLEISANKIIPLNEDEYLVEDFIGVSEKNIEEMFKQVESLIESIKNKDLKKLLQALFLQDNDFKQGFKNAPAAMYKHHNYIGGLLEHSLNVARIVDLYCSIYDLDRDLAVTGALLHDIGKLEEFEVTNNIKVSRKGHLIGHITLGVDKVLNTARALNLDENLTLKLVHIVLSHHGLLENASPKQPMFPEALAVYLADLADSKLFAMVKAKNTAVTEDDYIYTKDFGNVFLK